MWPDRRFLDLVKTEHPIVLAPMAGVMDAELVIAVAQGGGAGLAAMRDAVGGEGARAGQHHPPARLRADQHELLLPSRRSRPIRRVRPDGSERLGALLSGAMASIPHAPVNAANRAPFDAAMCAVVEELKPEVVSFHFGLPEPALLSASRRRARS